MALNRDRFLELLRAEQYPLRYTHKFIGKNTAAFRAGVREMGDRFPQATLEGFRESGESHAYLAYTYVQVAGSAEEIMAFVDATATLVDLTIIL